MKWVVDTSGREVSDIAKKLGVPESYVNGWMRKRCRISLAKLQNLSYYVRRPLAVFLLDKPPSQPEIRDCGMPGARITHETALAVRTARCLQEAAGEMMIKCGQNPRRTCVRV